MNEVYFRININYNYKPLILNLCCQLLDTSNQDNMTFCLKIFFILIFTKKVFLYKHSLKKNMFSNK